MNKSDSIQALAEALAKAQGELRNPAFDSQNPHFKSKYASLAAVRDSVIPILSSHGLSISQLPVCEDGKAGCETILLHTSGEYISSVLLLPVERPTAHGVGSALTYARRYAMMALAGVVGDDDDDGNAAVGNKQLSGTIASPIAPTDGCWEQVPKERHEPLRRIGSGVIDFFAANDAEGAFDYLEEVGLDQDEKVCVWTLLGSKERAALKKIGTARKAAATFKETENAPV